MKVRATNPCATGTCPPKNLLPQGYLDMMRMGGMGSPIGTVPTVGNPMGMPMAQPMPQRPQPQQRRGPAGPQIDPRQLCDDNYAAIAMLPIFGGALAGFAGTVPDPVTMLGTGIVAVAQHWQRSNYPACGMPSVLHRGAAVGVAIARCFVEGEALQAVIADLARKGLPVGGGAASASTPSSGAPAGNPAPFYGPPFGGPVGPYYGGVADMAPQGPGVGPVYGPGPFPTLAASYGQGCFSPYDCPPGQYCHEGVCMPSPWAGGHMGVTQEPGGRQHRGKNPADVGGTAVNLAAAGFGQLLDTGPPPTENPG